MILSLAVLNQYFYGKKEFLACSSSSIKQVCLPVAEAAFFTFVSDVLVGESASLKSISGQIAAVSSDMQDNIQCLE